MNWSNFVLISIPTNRKIEYRVIKWHESDVIITIEFKAYASNEINSLYFYLIEKNNLDFFGGLLSCQGHFVLFDEPQFLILHV